MNYIRSSANNSKFSGLVLTLASRLGEHTRCPLEIHISCTSMDRGRRRSCTALSPTSLCRSRGRPALPDMDRYSVVSRYIRGHYLPVVGDVGESHHTIVVSWAVPARRHIHATTPPGIEQSIGTVREAFQHPLDFFVVFMQLFPSDTIYLSTYK